MLNIPSEIKDLYKTDSTPKVLTLYFPSIDLTILHDQIVSETFTLTERLCPDTTLKFGSCVASEITVIVADVTQDVKGLTCVISQEIGEYTVPFGTYIIENAEKQDNLRYKKITAYDLMTKIDVDVSGWYNGLFALGTEIYTLAEFRTSLYTYLGLTEDTSNLPLPNDSMSVSKTISPSEISGRVVIEACEEINGAFGHINRSGQISHIILTEMHEDYPADDYPETDYPIDEPYDEYISQSDYKKINFEEYRIQPIDKIQIRQEENDVGAIYGTGTNAYIIQGNLLVYGKSASDLLTIATNISTNIFNRGHRPYTAFLKGLPYVEVGDFVKFDANDTTAGYVLYRNMAGIQALQDEFADDGTEEQTQTFGVSNEIIQIKSKAATIEKSVEAVKVTVSDLETELSGEIDVLAGQVVLKVNSSGKIGYVELNADPNTDLTEITIEADNISLEGLVTVNNNFKVLADGSIEAVNGKFSGEITGSTFVASNAFGRIEIDGPFIMGWNASNVNTLSIGYDGAISCNAVLANSMQISNNVVLHVGNLVSQCATNGLVVPSASYAYSAGETISCYRLTNGSNYTYTSVNDNLLGSSPSAMYIGSSANPWAGGFGIADWITISDERKKYDIKNPDERFVRFAKMIAPKMFKLKQGSSGRDHSGFIAQDVELDMVTCGISDMEFAGLIKSPIYDKFLKDEEGNDTTEYDTTSNIIGYDYGLRYNEFIPLLFLLYNA